MDDGEGLELLRSIDRRLFALHVRLGWLLIALVAGPVLVAIAISASGS
jgi:hypothetical protein